MNNVREMCGDCDHFLPQPTQIVGTKKAGMCLRYPPTVQLIPFQVPPDALKGKEGSMSMVPQGFFPPVMSTTTSCGEFVAKGISVAETD